MLRYAVGCRHLDPKDRRGVAFDLVVKTGAVLQAALRLFLVATAGSALAPPLVSGWQTTVPGFGFPHETASAVGVAATSDNDVVVVGGLHFIVLKLAATSGQEIWRYDLGDGFTSAVAVDTTGDVIAAGFVQGQARLTVVKLSGPTGSELWRQDVAGTDPFGSSWASDVAVDPMGDVLRPDRWKTPARVMTPSSSSSRVTWAPSSGGTRATAACPGM